jgi:hypothetical protein
MIDLIEWSDHWDSKESALPDWYVHGRLRFMRSSIPAMILLGLRPNFALHIRHQE